MIINQNTLIFVLALVFCSHYYSNAARPIPMPEEKKSTDNGPQQIPLPPFSFPVPLPPLPNFSFPGSPGSGFPFPFPFPGTPSALTPPVQGPPTFLPPVVAPPAGFFPPVLVHPPFFPLALGVLPEFRVSGFTPPKVETAEFSHGIEPSGTGTTSDVN